MQMSLTRLLNEIKLTDSKIVNGVSNQFIVPIVGSKLPQGFQTKAELEANLKGNYQSVKDLLAYRNKLKSILVSTNAVTKVTVAGEDMTIAQAIERKRTIDLDKRLLNSLSQQFSRTSTEIVNHNTKVEQNIDAQLQNLFGKDRKVTQEETEAVSGPYRKQHEATAVDPLNVRNELKVLGDFIQQFESEVDFVLSEANARTFIEI